MPALTMESLQAAEATVAAVMSPTPQYCWPLLAAEAGCEVWLKHENHTPTGAFKVRGGLVYLEQLMRQKTQPAGLVTATRGNHGQSIPFAAARHGLPVTVLAPEGNSVEKNEAMIHWGARLLIRGRDFDESRGEAERLARQENLLYVPSFHSALVRGVATYAYELFRAVRDLDVVYVPIGMGSGICGTIGVRDLLGLKTEVVGVVAAAAPAMQLSVAAGALTETDSAHTIADGMACRTPSAEAFEQIRSGAARLVAVSEDEIAGAMRSLFRGTHNVVEGAGAAGYAALLQERDQLVGKRVAVIITGGNVDTALFAEVLAGHTPQAS